MSEQKKNVKERVERERHYFSCEYFVDFYTALIYDECVIIASQQWWSISDKKWLK